jgi:hypothetical protein
VIKAVAVALFTAAVTAAPAAAQTDKPQLKGTLTYTRSGGIDGVSDRLTIRRTGRARLNGGESFRLRTVERDGVAKLLADSDFASLKPKDAPAPPDSLRYTIAYRGHTLRFNDASEPKKVKQLANLLRRLVQKYDET